MSIPKECTVLVIGGGPGGSYAATVLAREGIDTILLEANVFPRYHIGESMLPSLRNYLRFIDLDSQFDSYGFTKKTGAAFKMSPDRREGFTDFSIGGPENYSWNVIRSEADDMMFRHAGKCGAKIFDGVKVDSIAFGTLTGDLTNGSKTSNGTSGSEFHGLGRPVSASYTRKADGLRGVVKFDYIIDASGRAGLLSTKYLKNRSYNQQFKNIATWGYWEGTGEYAPGTKRFNAPFFEALHDGSGWAWFIPLHDGTTSVGITMNQERAKARKAANANTSDSEFYNGALQLAPDLVKLLGTGRLVSGLKSASDYSYSSSTYAIPHARIVGDAGCFIDPFFSSGVHIALMGSLSAATTISAALRKDCSEDVAAKWHSNKIRWGYARFLLIVLGAYKQMRNQDEYILSDFGEDNFDRAFTFFGPVIQGAADSTSTLTQAEFSKTVEFLDKVMHQKFAPIQNDEMDPEETVLAQMRSRQSHLAKTMDDFTTDVVDGRVPNLEMGKLGLVMAS